MKAKELILAGTISAMVFATSFADDFDSFGMDSFGSSFGDSSVSALSVSGKAWIDMRGYLNPNGTSSDDYKLFDDVQVKVLPSAKLNLEYSGSVSDVLLALKVDENTIKNHPIDVIDELALRGYFGNFSLEAGKMKLVWGKGDKLHVLDNFNADDYTDFIIPDYIDRRLSTPMVRTAYSFGVANLNLEAVYAPFLTVDRFATNGVWVPAAYNELSGAVKNSATSKVKDAFEKYTKASASAGTLNALLAEYQAAAGAHKTVSDKKTLVDAAVKDGKGSDIDPDTNKTYSELQPYLATKLSEYESLEKATQAAYEGAVEGKIGDEAAKLTAAGEAYMYALNNANSLNSDPDMIYPDLKTLKYGQFGTRLTGTFGSFDWGLSYYNGFYKQPSFNATKLDTWLNKYLAKGTTSEDDKFLAYDRKQTFGFEAATTLWRFNLRGEAAYNLTEDVDGTDAFVHNNSVAWLGGFDIDLPFWNMNLNVQETGTAILKNDEIKSSRDVDYNENAYTNNKFVVNVTTSFMNEKILPEVTVLYGIENGDLIVMPKFTFKPDQSLSLYVNGMYIYSRDDNSEFAAWKNNSFINVGMSYQF